MGEIPRLPVSETVAWYPSAFEGDNSWIEPLGADELEEIDRAIATVRDRGLAPMAFGADDFPIDRFKSRVDRAREELENGRGFVLLRGVPVERYNEEEARIFFWGLSVHLGAPTSQNARGELLGEVMDRGYDYSLETVRGYTTHERLNPHNDSADCVFLLCMHPAMKGGASQIASSITIFNEILGTCPEHLEILCRGFHYDLRGEGRTGDPNEVTRHRVPVFSYHAGRLSCRYNAKSIISGMEKAGKPLSAAERAAVDTFGRLAVADGIRFDMDFQRGDVQLLNNHVLVHSRSAFEDWPEPERKRRLFRSWVNLPNSRPLDPMFADRWNTGPRGGVHYRPEAGYWSEEQRAPRDNDPGRK